MGGCGGGSEKKLLVFVVAMVVVIGGIESLELCKINDDGLTACKPSVTNPQPLDPPSAQCCEALKAADLPCLCGYKNSFLLPSLGIDPGLAIALPAKCNLTTPPNC